MGTSNSGSSGGISGKGRIETLTDGIFGIAMTLLVLDIRVPKLPNEITTADLAYRVFAIWPKFLIYVLSFVILAIFWVSHSIQFHYVRRANRTLFWINILILMLVAFIPFSTHLLSEHIEQQFAVAFYGTHLMLIWVCEFLHWYYVTTGGRLVDSDADPHVVNAVTRRILFSTITYLIAIAVSFYSTKLSITVYGMIIIMCILPGRIDRYWDDSKK
jgi:uncharacterized membrane protein